MCVLLLLASTAVAQFFASEIKVTEALERGQVDWTEGLVLSRESVSGSARRGAVVQTSQAAIQAARRGLLAAFGQVRFDASQMLGQVIRQREAPQQEVEALIAQAEVIETRYQAGGAVETAVQVPFAGRLTALVFPTVPALTPESEPKTEAVHTGVVIDARGLAIQPALFPRLVDERGTPLYTPELVEMEAAVQQGYVTYAKTLEQAPVQARIGDHPLVLRALRVAGPTRVDLTLSNADATRLLDYAATRRLVHQCRVVILM